MSEGGSVFPCQNGADQMAALSKANVLCSALAPFFAASGAAGDVLQNSTQRLPAEPAGSAVDFARPVVGGIAYAQTATATSALQPAWWGERLFNFESDTLVNIHIPKTAGSMFEEKVLPSVVAPAPCFPAKAGEKFRSDPFSMRCPRPNSKYDGNEWLLARNTQFGWQCGTHAGYDMLLQCLAHKKLLNENTRFITVMRSPVDRFVSEYGEVTDGWRPQEGEKWLRCPTPANVTRCGSRKGLELFSFCPHGQSESHNRQTRMLFKGEIECADVDDVDGMRRQQKQTLESALHTVREKKVLVGVTERLATSLRYFQHELGLKLNVSSADSFETHEYELPAVTRLRIEELEWMDTAVYKEANSLLDEFEEKEAATTLMSRGTHESDTHRSLRAPAGAQGVTKQRTVMFPMPR